MQPTYQNLQWAYQLHYDVGFRTHRRRPHFADPVRGQRLQEIMGEVCRQRGCHLLGARVYANHVRCLLSLQPGQDISTVMEKLKAYSSRECGQQFSLVAPVWARGYFVQSVGRVNLSIVKQYIAHQSEHHGYAARHHPPVYRYCAGSRLELTAAHSCFELNHHVVVSTQRRASVFDSTAGQALSGYWLKVAAKRGFVVDQVTIVPDHAHLLLRIPPKISIEFCVQALLNNGEHFVCNTYPQALAEAGIDQLWQPSAYAGTCGKVSTALVKAWLSAP